MELKASIVLAICLCGMTKPVIGKAKHNAKKQDDKQNHPYSYDSQQFQTSTTQSYHPTSKQLLHPQQQIQLNKQQQIQLQIQLQKKLNQLLKKRNEDLYTSQTSWAESGKKYEREQATVPLVLSPENLQNLKFSPTVSVTERSKFTYTTAKPKAQKQKTAADYHRRQTKYNEAITSLLESAINVANGVKATEIAANNKGVRNLNNLHIPNNLNTQQHLPSFVSHQLYEPAPIQHHQFGFQQPIQQVDAQQFRFLQRPAPFAAPTAATQPENEETGLYVQPTVLSNKRNVGTERENEENTYAAKYQFGFRVVDTHSGSDYGRSESRDGGLTTGHYHVLLPDGRMQTVRYWSDATGFHAHISYDKEAVHM